MGTSKFPMVAIMPGTQQASHTFEQLLTMVWDRFKMPHVLVFVCFHFLDTNVIEPILLELLDKFSFISTHGDSKIPGCIHDLGDFQEASCCVKELRSTSETF